jgi:putative inorganic carbon (hco3(-)) transporter
MSRPAPPQSRTHAGRLVSDAAGPMAWSMALYIAIVVGRLMDVMPALASIPLAKIVAGAVVILAIANRRSLSAHPLWSIPVFRTAIYFFAVMTASLLFSIWKGQTAATIGNGITTLLGLILVLKSARSWPSVRVMLMGCVWAATILTIGTLLNFAGGRAGGFGSYDPNDVALVLVTLLPIVAAFAFTSAGIRKASHLAVAGLLIVTVLLTQSRGGLLGLLVLAVTFAVAPPTPERPQRADRRRYRGIVLRLCGLAVIGAIAWNVVPLDARQRLSTLFAPSADYNTNPDEEGRFTIWERNLRQFATRPIGFGAGAFPMVDLRAGGRFRAPHNTFLQVLIELGVPGLLLFLRALVQSFRRLAVRGPTVRDAEDVLPTDGQRRAAARAVRLSLLTIALCGFFLSMAYANIVWIIVALSGAITVIGTSVSNNEAAVDLDDRGRAAGYRHSVRRATRR